MKRLAVLLFTIVVLFAPLLPGQMLQPIPAGPQMSSLSVGLVGWWKLDEGTTNTSTADSSVSGNTGTWVGTQSGTSGWYSTGKVGPWAGAFLLANTDRVAAGQTGLSNASMSACAWYNPSVVSAVVQTLVADNKASTTVGWAVNADQDSTGAAASGKITGWFGDGTSSHNTGNSGAVLSNGVWIHICVANQNQGAFALYVNGSFISSNNSSTSISYPSGTTFLVGRDATSANYTSGLLDDARVYNRALTAREVQELYRSQK